MWNQRNRFKNTKKTNEKILNKISNSLNDSSTKNNQNENDEQEEHESEHFSGIVYSSEGTQESSNSPDSQFTKVTVNPSKFTSFRLTEDTRISEGVSKQNKKKKKKKKKKSKVEVEEKKKIEGSDDEDSYLKYFGNDNLLDLDDLVDEKDESPVKIEKKQKEKRKKKKKKKKRVKKEKKEKKKSVEIEVIEVEDDENETKKKEIEEDDDDISYEMLFGNDYGYENGEKSRKKKRDEDVEMFDDEKKVKRKVRRKRKVKKKKKRSAKRKGGKRSVYEANEEDEDLEISDFEEKSDDDDIKKEETDEISSFESPVPVKKKKKKKKKVVKKKRKKKRSVIYISDEEPSVNFVEEFGKNEVEMTFPVVKEEDKEDKMEDEGEEGFNLFAEMRENAENRDDSDSFEENEVSIFAPFVKKRGRKKKGAYPLVRKMDQLIKSFVSMESAFKFNELEEEFNEYIDVVVVLSKRTEKFNFTVCKILENKYEKSFPTKKKNFIDVVFWSRVFKLNKIEERNTIRLFPPFQKMTTPTYSLKERTKILFPFNIKKLKGKDYSDEIPFSMFEEFRATYRNKLLSEYDEDDDELGSQYITPIKQRKNNIIETPQIQHNKK